MTIVTMDQDLEIQARKALGRAHLDADRIEDALQVFAGILRDYPNDVESYLFLGDCYLADGDGETAYLFYKQAADISPHDADIQRRLSLAKIECSQTENIATDPESVARLLQKLTGRRNPVTDEEVQSAAKLLDEIVHSPHPTKVVSQRMDEIDSLLPALLDLNIRQARADGRADLAMALQDLLDNIQLQINVQAASTTVEPQDSSENQNLPKTSCQAQMVSGSRRVLILSDSSAHPDWNALFANYSPPGKKCSFVVSDGLTTKEDVSEYDVVLAHNPHGSPEIMGELASCTARKIPIVLYLDAGFEQMPLDHPLYERYGLGTPERARAYTASLLLADRICVSSENLGASLRGAGYSATVMPKSWSYADAHWAKQNRNGMSLTLGWVGGPGQLEDVARVRRIIIRVVREFSNTRLLIAGDPKVYQLFGSLPESRRIYVPFLDRNDYPYMLSQIDILVVPLRNTPFNRTLSDRRLVEAGMLEIPWVASPIPSYVAWNMGGLIANSTDEWHTHLRQMVMDKNLRTSLGWAGRQLAKTRSSQHVGKLWCDLLCEVTRK